MLQFIVINLFPEKFCPTEEVSIFDFFEVIIDYKTITCRLLTPLIFFWMNNLLLLFSDFFSQIIITFFSIINIFFLQIYLLTVL